MRAIIHTQWKAAYEELLNNPEPIALLDETNNIVAVTLYFGPPPEKKAEPKKTGLKLVT